MRFYHRPVLFPLTYNCKISAGWKVKGKGRIFGCAEIGFGKPGMYLILAKFFW